MGDYKINPESIPNNATVYKKVELTREDVIGESRKTLEDLLMESYKHALHEGIKANTVILDKNFCKVNGFGFLIGGWDYKRFPPMICGMEIRGISDGELPEGYDFAVLEATMTEREALVRDTTRGVIHRIRKELHDGCACVEDYPDVTYAINRDDIDRILNNLLKEVCHDSTSDESNSP